MRLPHWLRRVLLRAALRTIGARPPDFVLPGYLNRWHLVRTRWGCLYVHQIVGSDDDRALHDHRSWNVSMVLAGVYWEHLPEGPLRYRVAGDIVIRRAATPHRIEISKYSSPVTLFLTGPHQRDWGFIVDGQWVRHVEFLEARAGES